jgi:SAM-dependent methyltransferase
MTNPNAEQIAYWSGRAGEGWTQQQERMDRSIGPLGLAAMEAANVRPGEGVVDIGCGCGDTSLELARRVGPSGRVLGVDVSRPMIARAQVRGAGITQLSFVESDASTSALPEATDLLFSRFGVMFFADPIAAFTHLRSQIRASGRLAFVTWRTPADNPWAKLPLDAVAPHLPPPTPTDPRAPGPFAFADRTYLEGLLTTSGFREVSLTRLDRVLRWTDGPSLDEAVASFTQIGPSARRLAEAAPEARARALQALGEALAPQLTNDGVALGASVWVVTARP